MWYTTLFSTLSVHGYACHLFAKLQAPDPIHNTVNQTVNSGKPGTVHNTRGLLPAINEYAWIPSATLIGCSKSVSMNETTQCIRVRGDRATNKIIQLCYLASRREVLSIKHAGQHTAQIWIRRLEWSTWLTLPPTGKAKQAKKGTQLKSK